MAEGEAGRVLLWVTWSLNMLITTTYMLLSFATSNNMYKSYKNLNIGLHNTIWRAPAAAAVLGGIMVLIFNLASLIILIKKSIHRSGPSFDYGFVVAWCFVMSFFCLLCGIVLDGFKPIVEKQLTQQTSWTEMDTGAFVGTYALAYLCSAMFLLLFLCMLIFQGAISKQLGVYDHLTAQRRMLELNGMTGPPMPLTPATMARAQDSAAT